jgi:hypothetical protein
MKIAWGLLGWSNKRAGVEFYRWDEKIIPRHKSEWGDLLALEDEAVKDMEGSSVIVIVLPRSATKEELITATHSVQAALGMPAP